MEKENIQKPIERRDPKDRLKDYRDKRIGKMSQEDLILKRMENELLHNHET